MSKKTQDSPEQKLVDANEERAERFRKLNDRQKGHANLEAREEAAVRGMHYSHDDFEKEREAQVEAVAKFEAAQRPEKVQVEQKEEEKQVNAKDYSRSNFETSNEIENPTPVGNESDSSVPRRSRSKRSR